MRRRDENPNPGPLGDLREHVGQHWIRLHCTHCMNSREFNPLDLIGRYGEISCATLVSKAVCGRCGGRMPEFRLRSPCLPDWSDAPPRGLG